MADEMDINLEVFNLETDFFGDLHCSSRFTDMNEIKALRKNVGNGGE